MTIDVKKLKRGVRFLHAIWVDDEFNPLVCQITSVKDGVVSWKQPGTKKASACFSIENADKRIKELLS